MYHKYEPYDTYQEYIDAMKSSYTTNYPNPKIVFIQTPEIKMTHGKIPPLETAKTDEQRITMKIPYDTSQPECKELKTFLEQLDQHMEMNMKNIFKETPSKFKYEYKPIVKEPEKLESNESESDLDSFNIEI